MHLDRHQLPEFFATSRPSAISNTSGAQSGHVTWSHFLAMGIQATLQVDEGLPEITLPP
jgi:hypothetical protein